jgi:hypothetical protein
MTMARRTLILLSAIALAGVGLAGPAGAAKGTATAGPAANNRVGHLPDDDITGQDHQADVFVEGWQYVPSIVHIKQGQKLKFGNYDMWPYGAGGLLVGVAAGALWVLLFAGPLSVVVRIVVTALIGGLAAGMLAPLVSEHEPGADLEQLCSETTSAGRVLIEVTSQRRDVVAVCADAPWVFGAQQLDCVEAQR